MLGPFRGVLSVLLVASFVVGTALAAPARYVLDNGLTVVHQQERGAPLVTVQVWVRTGSCTEGALQGSGISHFVEHMLFKGTPTRAVGDYAKEIQSYGGSLNAYTTYDRTVYFFTISSRFFEKGLDAIADVVRNSTFPADEVVKEQEVIRREIAMGKDSPRSRLWETMAQTAFRFHHFRDPVIGYREVFDRLTRDDLVAYHAERYVPNNCILSVAGDVSASQLRAAVDASFASWERRAVEPVLEPDEPPQVAPRTVVFPFDVQKTRLQVAWRGVSARDPEVHAVDVLGIIAGNGQTSRFYRRLKEKDRLVFDAFASSWTPVGPGLFIAGAELERANVDRALAAMDEEAALLCRELVSDEELERAKAKVVAGQVLARETVEGMADAIGDGEFQQGDAEYADRAVAAIKAVTREQVRAAARRVLRPETKTVIVLEPRGESVSAVAETSAAAATESPADAVQTFTLPNGLRVLVLERPRLPLATVAVSFLGGSRYETGFPAGIASTLGEMITRGTTTRTAEEIAAALENVGSNLVTVANDEIWGVRAVVLKEYLKLGVDVVSDAILHPTFPGEELDKVKEVQLAAIATERDQPMSAARLDYRRLRYGDHPWGRSPYGTADSVASITPEALRRYLAATATAGRAIVSVVGDVKVDQVRTLLGAAFAALPAGPGTAGAPPVPPVAGVRQDRADLPGKQQAVVIVGFQGCPLDSPDRYPLDVMNGILSGLGNRLFRNLRGLKSLAYSVGSYLDTGLDTKTQIFFIATDPNRVDEATQGLLDEARAMTEALVTDAEIERSKAAIVGEGAISLQENRSLACLMAYDELAGLGYRYHFDYAKKIMAVSREQILDVARRYLTFDRRVVAVVGPPMTPAAPDGKGASAR